jgi:hypothetical protein
VTLGRRELLAALLAAAALPAATVPAAREFRRKVPFYAGRSDLDAGLAGARMALSFFEPMEHFPVADVAEMTYYTDGYWFFEPQLAPIMLEKGRKVELFSDLDYGAVAVGQGLNRFGPDAEKIIDRKALRWALDKGAAAAKRPALDLSALLEKFRAGGFLMIAADRGVLRREPALPYCRYHLVVTGFGDGRIHYHDPSVGPDRSAPADLIERACGAPAAGRSALLIA